MSDPIMIVLPADLNGPSNFPLQRFHGYRHRDFICIKKTYVRSIFFELWPNFWQTLRGKILAVSTPNFARLSKYEIVNNTSK